MTTFSSQCLTESFTVASWKFNRTIMIAFQGLRRKNKMSKPSRQQRQGKRDLKKNNSGVFKLFTVVAIWLYDLPFFYQKKKRLHSRASFFREASSLTTLRRLNTFFYWWPQEKNVLNVKCIRRSTDDDFPCLRMLVCFAFFPLPPLQFKPFVQKSLP